MKFNTTILKDRGDGYAEFNGDLILISGIDFSQFNKNPVVTKNYDKANPPIGKVTGIQTDENGMTAEIELADNLLRGGVSANEEIKALAENGLAEFSISAMPIESETRINRAVIVEVSLISKPTK